MDGVPVKKLFLYIAFLALLLGSENLYSTASIYTFDAVGGTVNSSTLTPDTQIPDSPDDTWIINGNGTNDCTLTLSGAISCTSITLDNKGGGSLTLSLNGQTVTVSGAMDFATAVNINANGTLSVGTFTNPGNLSVTNAGSLNLTVSGTTTLPTAFVSISSLTKTGATTLTVGHNVNTSGALNINSGTYSATASATTCGSMSINGTFTGTGQVLSTSSINAGGAATITCERINSVTSTTGGNNITYNLSPNSNYIMPVGITAANNLNFTPGAAVTVTLPNVNLSISNKLSTNGNTSLNFNTTGTKTLSYANVTLTNPFSKNGNGVQIVPTNFIGQNITVNAGTLRYNGNVNFGNNTVVVNGSAILDINGNCILGTSTLTMNSSGTIDISGTFTCSGMLDIINGTVNVSSNVVSLNAVKVATNRNFNIGGTADIVTATIDNGATISVSGNITSITTASLQASARLIANGTANVTTLNGIADASTVTCDYLTATTVNNPENINFVFNNIPSPNYSIPFSSYKSLNLNAINPTTILLPDADIIFPGSFTSSGTINWEIITTADRSMDVNGAAFAGTFTKRGAGNLLIDNAPTGNFQNFKVEAGTLVISKNVTFLGALNAPTGNIRADMSANDVTINIGAESTWDGEFSTTGDHNLTISTSNHRLYSGGNFTLNPGAGAIYTINTGTQIFYNDEGAFLFNGNTGNEILHFTRELRVTGGSFTFNGGAGDDVLRVDRHFYATNGVTVAFNGNSGNDLFDCNDEFRIQTNGTTVTFNGGAGNDNHYVTDDFDMDNNSTYIFNGGNGNDRLLENDRIEISQDASFTFNGDAGNDEVETNIITAVNSSSISFDGGADNDILDINNYITHSNSSDFTFVGGSGDDQVDVRNNFNFHSTGTFSYSGGSGDDLFICDNYTQNNGSFIYNGGNENNTFRCRDDFNFSSDDDVNFTSGTGDDRYIFDNYIQTDGALTFDAGDGRNDFDCSVNFEFSASGHNAIFTGGTGIDDYNFVDFTQTEGNLTFNFGAGNDRFESTGTFSYTTTGGALQITSGAGDDDFRCDDFRQTSGTFTYIGNAGDDEFVCTGDYSLSTNTTAFSYDGGAGNDLFQCMDYNQNAGTFTYVSGTGNDLFKTRNFIFNDNSSDFSYIGDVAGTNVFSATTGSINITAHIDGQSLIIHNANVTAVAGMISMSANGNNTDNVDLGNNTITSLNCTITGDVELNCPVDFAISNDLTYFGNITNVYSAACTNDLIGPEVIIAGGTTFVCGATAGHNMHIHTNQLTVNGGHLIIQTEANGTLDIKALDGSSDLPSINVTNNGTLDINSSVIPFVLNVNNIQLNNGGDLNLLTNNNDITLNTDNITVNNGTFDFNNGGGGNSNIKIDNLLSTADNADATLDMRGGDTAGELTNITIMEGATFGNASNVYTDKQDLNGGDGIDDTGTFITIHENSTSPITLHHDMKKIFKLYIFSNAGTTLSNDIVVGEFDLDRDDTDGNEGLFVLDTNTFQLNKYKSDGDDLGTIDASNSALDLTSIWDNVDMGPTEIVFLSNANTDLLIEEIINTNVGSTYTIDLPALPEIRNFTTSVDDLSAGDVKLVFNSDLYVHGNFFAANYDDDGHHFEIDLNGYKITVHESFSGARDLQLGDDKTMIQITANEGPTPSGTFCGIEIHGDIDWSNYYFNTNGAANTEQAFDLTINEWGKIDSVFDFNSPKSNRFIRHIVMDRALPTLKMADPVIASLTIDAGHVHFFDDGGDAALDYEVEGDVFINDGGFLRLADQNETNGHPMTVALCTNPGAQMTGSGGFHAAGYGGLVELTFGDVAAEHSGKIDFTGTWYSDEAIDITYETKIATSNQTQYLHEEILEARNLTFYTDDDGKGNRYVIVQSGDLDLEGTLTLGDNIAGHTGTVSYTVNGKDLLMATSYDDTPQSRLDASTSLIDFGAGCSADEGELIFDKETTAVFRGGITVDASDDIWTVKNLHLYNNAANTAGGQLTLLHDLTVYKNLMISADSEGDDDDAKLISNGYNIDVFGSLFCGPQWVTNDGILLDTDEVAGRYTVLKIYHQFGGGADANMFSNTDDLILHVLEGTP